MKPLKKILIAGPATDAALAAMFLKRGNPSFDIQLLVTPTRLDPAGEATTPFVLQQLIKTLGIRGADLHRIARPNWLLGFKMRWGARERYVRAFDGAPTALTDGLTTRNGFLAREEGFDEFSAGAALISSGKLFPKNGPNSVKMMEQITGLVLQPGPLAELLAQGCKALAIPRREAEIAEVRVTDGEVQAVVLADGSELTADLYIDLTGQDASILGALGTSSLQNDGTQGLCTRAWTAAKRRGNEAIRPFVSIDTHESGWKWRIEHDDRIGIGLAFHHEFTSDEEALADLREMVREPLEEPILHQWNHGCQSHPWSGNVLAMGDAAAFLEPLAAVRLPLLILHLNAFQRIVAEIPTGPGEQGKALYHRMIKEAWQELRDFTNVHHQFNTASDSPYWKFSRENCGPGVHHALVDLFMSGGPEPILENAMPYSPCALGYDTWLTALIGLGVPVSHPPTIPTEDAQAWRTHIQSLSDQASKGATAETCLKAVRKQSATPRKRPTSY